MMRIGSQMWTLGNRHLVKQTSMPSHHGLVGQGTKGIQPDSDGFPVQIKGSADETEPMEPMVDLLGHPVGGGCGNDIGRNLNYSKDGGVISYITIPSCNGFELYLM